MRIIILSLVLFFSKHVFSQNETDLFRFSKTTHHGSARFEGMGGAFGALGADPSSYQINPAGFGRFSSNHIGASFYGGSTSNEATFQGVNSKSSQMMGGLSTFSIILTEDISENSNGFVYRQFGFGYNLVENFRNTFHYEGQQYESVLDGFVGQAQGYTPEELNTYFPFSTDLAYQTYAISYDNAAQEYYSLLNSGDMKHFRTVEMTGGVKDFYFSYSANYLNKLYLGGNIALRYNKYTESYLHTEALTDTTGTNLRSFDYSYNLNTQGVGVNLKIGAIYLVSEALRFGISIHTPTYSELTDEWNANMTSNFQDSSITMSEAAIPKGDYRYKIRSPFRVNGSAAYVFGTRGCVDLDLEYLNYQQAHFRSTLDAQYANYDYAYENAYADTVFQKTINARLGGEFVLIPGVYIRGGMSYYGNAFKKNMNSELKPLMIYSLGFGLKFGKFNCDIAYRMRTSELTYYAFPYSYSSLRSVNGSFILSGSFSL